MRERVLSGARLAASGLLIGASLLTSLARGASDPVPGIPPGEAGGPVGSDPPRVQEPASLIGGPSACPQPGQVWAELGTLVPRDRLSARLRAISGPRAPVEIFDLGVTYRVNAAGRVRAYRDDGRDCVERARIAALFVALAIDPEAILSEQPPVPPAAAPPTPAPPPSAPEPRRPMVRVDVGVAADGGLGSSDQVAQAGVAVRLAIGRQVGVVAGVIALAPVDNTVAGLRLRQWRVPADLCLRATFNARRVQPYAELGLLAAWLSERAVDLAVAQARTALELGLRAAVGLYLATRSAFAPFAALHAEVVPDPPDVFALPRGVVGTTPAVWIGATVGASLGVFP